MRMINPSVAIITEKDPFKKIEKVGRTCYKSEDKITEDSARKFYKGLVSRKHTAMVEHATFVFQVDKFQYDVIRNAGNKYLNYTADNYRYLVSGNLRALNESGLITLCREVYDLDPELIYNEELEGLFNEYKIKVPGNVSIVDLSKLPDLTVNEFMHHAYFTFHFITDRGVTHEMVRHRPASYAQESTRYCNYVKEQFGSELTFVKPAHWDTLPDNIKLRYARAWETAEDEYARLISYGQTPQQARAVLPNALKTEIIMTANAKEYEHFFDLRSRGVTGAPHPDIKVVADMALELYEVEKMILLGV